MKRVLVIGGTSGMGLGLARAYAAQGARVTVIGRDIARLPEASRLDGIIARAADVTDPVQIKAAVQAESQAGLDLLIYSAGYYAREGELQDSPEKQARMMATNVAGIRHVFDAAIPNLRAGGQLVAIASIAGLLRPDAQATQYALSKREAIDLCERYRLEVATLGLEVVLLIPGYVDTAQLRFLNGGRADNKPFLVSEERAVQGMLAAIEQRRQRFVFPWPLHALVRIYNRLPRTLRSMRKGGM